MHWFINGTLSNQVAVNNRGLAYGDGLFETMRAVNSDIPLIERHMSRLKNGADRLGLDVDLPVVKRLLEEALIKNDADQSVVKLICVRSGESTGYQGAQKSSDILIRLTDLVMPEKSAPVRAKLCELKLAQQPLLAGIKHLNRLEQVLAANELSEEYDEGILLDVQENLIEAISNNLIFVSGESLIFPDLSHAGVEGVMQAYIKDEAASLGFKILEKPVRFAELDQFDEILLSNAVRGIRNLASIFGHWQSKGFVVGNRIREHLQSTLSPDFVSF